ncbi:MAG: CoA-binding protein [Pseudomonadota bacterium]
MFLNPKASEIRELLQKTRTIAVVGLSPRADRPSHFVARNLQRFGFRIVPVRPAVGEILGEKAYATLEDIPFPVDLVDVFRAPEHAPEAVEACLRIKCPAIWLQEGVVNEAAAQAARAAGLTVVMDRCIYKDYVDLMTA